MKQVRPLLATILATLSVTALAGPLNPRPIGLIGAKGVANTEQSDFFAISGAHAAKSPVSSSTKVVFSAQIKVSTSGVITRALFVQDLLARDTYLIDKNAPLKQIGTFTFQPGQKLDTFLRENSFDTVNHKVHYPQMFFHVPGKGLYGTEGGKPVKVVRAENAKDPATAVVGTAIRSSDFNFDGSGLATQARLFFATKDAKGGVEPFISAGTAATSKMLLDINTAKDPVTKKPLGSDPLQFAALGPQNETQRVFFFAKSPADNDTYQLWVVSPPTIVKGKPVYTASVFTTGVNAVAGAPQNLVSNSSDLFFTAPATAGGTPILWHLAAGSSSIESFSGTSDPQQLTFINEDSSYSALAFSSVDGGSVRRYARWSSFNGGTVTNLGAGLSNPTLITPAKEYFYFAATHGGSGDNYLEKHSLADNSITDILINDGFNTPYPARQITEICRVSNTIYFVSYGVLCRIDNDSGGTFNTVADVAYTDGGNYVVAPHNLGAVVDSGSPGFFRLYFSAPINKGINGAPAQNAEFIPDQSKITDFGMKPFMTQVE